MRGPPRVPPVQLNLGRQASAPPASPSPSPKAQLTALSIPAVPAARDGDHQGSELQIRREKFAFFEKHCSEVAERIFLSGDAVAKNEALLTECGITHVLNAVGFISSEYFRDKMQYCTFWLQDVPGEDLTCVLYPAFDFMEESLAAGGRLLVHCSQGVSRSASLVIAYLMWRDGKEYEETFRRVKAVRGIANPNMGFTCQLLQWAKRRRTQVTAPRLYVLSPHNAHDPRRLVARSTPGPTIDAVDARGSFVLQTATDVFIWVGPAAPPEFETAAALFAAQLSKYEGASLDPIRVTPGEEPAAFLDALSVPPEQRGPGGSGWLRAKEAHCAAFDDPFGMFTAGRRSDIALRAGEGAAELARAAGATKMDWEAAAEPAGKEGTSGQDEARDSLSATMPAPASHEENGDAFRSLPGGFRGFPVLRSLPEGSEGAATALSTFGTGPATSRNARGGDEAASRSGKGGKESRPSGGGGGANGAERAVLLQYPGFKALSMFDAEDLSSEGAFVLVAGSARRLFVWLGSEFAEAEGVSSGRSDDEGDDDGDDRTTALDVAKKIAEEAREAGAVGNTEGWAVGAEVEGSESAEFWDIFEG